MIAHTVVIEAVAYSSGDTAGLQVYCVECREELAFFSGEGEQRAMHADFLAALVSEHTR